MNVLILNGSPKKRSSTSGFLGRIMRFLLTGCRVEAASLRLPKDHPEILQKLTVIDVLILTVPLYVDGIPSHVLEFMQLAEAFCLEHHCRFSLYVISNNGFIEGSHNKTHLKMYECWCRHACVTWGGGIGIGGGKMLHVLSLYFPVLFAVMILINLIRYGAGASPVFSDWTKLLINLGIYLFFNCGALYCMIRLAVSIRRCRKTPNRYTRVMVPSFLFVPMADIFMVITSLFQGKILFTLLKKDSYTDS